MNAQTPNQNTVEFYPQVNTIQHLDRVDELFYAEKNQCLLSISADKSIRVLNLETYSLERIIRPILSLGRADIIYSGALSVDEKILAIGGNIGENRADILLVDWKSNKLVKRLEGHNNGVRTLAFSPDGQWLVSGGKDKQIKIWETKNWQLVTTLDGAATSIQQISFANKKDLFASASLDNTIKIWQLEENKWQLHTSLEEHKGVVFSLAFSPEDDLLISGGEDSALLGWEINNSWKSFPIAPKNFVLRRYALGAISFSKNSRYLAFKEDAIINNGLNTPEFAPYIHVFDFQLRKYKPPFKEHSNTILSTCFLGNDKLASSTGDGEIIIQNISTQEILYKTPTTSRPIISTAFGGNKLLTGFGHSLVGAKPYPLANTFDWANLTFSKELSANVLYDREKKRKHGNLQLIYQDQFNLQIGNCRKITFDNYKEGRIQTFGFSPNGEIIVLGDFIIKKYDKNGEFLFSFSGHTGEIRDFSISRNGQYLISGGTDHQLKLWNLNSGELLASLYVNQDGEWICWSPQGYYETSENGKALLSWWKQASKEELAEKIKTSALQSKFHKPALLQQIILSGSAQKALQNQFSKTLKVEIDNEEVVSNSKEFIFKGSIESASPLKDVQLHHNQELIILNNDFSRTAFKYILHQPLQLSKGLNSFQLTVKDENGAEQKKQFKISYQPIPELALSRSHEQAVKDMTFSSSGKLLATSSMDNSIKVWDLNTQRLKNTIQTNKDNPGGGVGIFSIQFSKDDTQLLCSDGSQKIMLYNVETGQLEKQFRDSFRIQNPINQLLFTADEKHIITCDFEGYIKVWDYQSGSVIKKFKEHTKSVKKLAISPKNSTLYSLGLDMQLIVWDLKTGKVQQKVPLKTAAQRSNTEDLFLELSDDGNYLLTGSNINGNLSLYHIREGQMDEVFEWTNQYELMDVAFVPNMHQLAFGYLTKPVKIWDIPSKNFIKQFEGMPNQFQSLTISPDKKYLASAHGILGQVKISIRDYKKNQEIYSLGNLINPINTVAVLPNKKLMAYGGADATMNIWDFTSMSKIDMEQPHSSCFLGARGINSIEISPDEKIMASAGCDRSIYIWNIDSLKVVHTLKHEQEINDLAFSSNGQYLASASIDQTIKVWEVKTGKNIVTLTGFNRGVSSLAFSPDDNYLVGGNLEELLLWNWRDSTIVKQITTNFQPVHPHLNQPFIIDGQNYGPQREYIPSEKITLLFAKDGKSVFVGGEPLNKGTIHLWLLELNQLTLFSSLAPNFTQKITSLAIDPSNKYLFAGTTNPFNIAILDIKTGAIQHSLIGHQAIVSNLAFDQNGQRLISASHDGSLKFWDWTTCQPTSSFYNYGENAFTISTPKHYFYTNKNSAKEIAFKLDDNLIPQEQFDLLLNRPDIILQQFGYADELTIKSYNKAYQKRLNKMGFEEKELKLDFTNIPEITLQKPSESDYSKFKEYTFTIVANGNQEYLKQLNLYVNDVPIFGKNGLKYANDNLNIIKKEITLTLSNGKNKIQVSALNNSGIESLKETFYITYEGVPEKPNLYLFTFGVDKYDNADSLRFSEKDAKDIQQLFQRSGLDFDKIYEYPLLGESFSKEAVQKLSSVLANTKVDDQVIIFYAGHGFLNKESDFFLSCQHTNFYQPKETSVSYEMLERLIDSIPARQKLVLIDACHSGEIDKDYDKKIQNANTNQTTTTKFRSTRDTGLRSPQIDMNNSFELMKELFVDLRRGTGATIIAAARGVELARESPLIENGFFTHALINGLKNKEADLNKDGKITVSELKEYVSKKVPELTNGLQQPTSRLENTTNDFRIW